MITDLSVEASHGGSAAGRDQTFNYEPSPALVKAIMRPLEVLNKEQREEINCLRERLGTSDGILHRVAAILTKHLERGDIEFDQLPRMLVELVNRRQAEINHERTRPQDPDIAFAKLQKKLEAALLDGDDEQAQKLFEQKRDAKLAAIKESRRAEERLRHTAIRGLLDAAECEAGLGELARGRLEYRLAAKHFRAAADLLSDDTAHSSQRFSYLDRAAEVLCAQGEEFGDNDALREAIDGSQAILKEYSRKNFPLQWARIQNNLGITLTTLGGRETNTKKLELAIKAFRSSLKEYSRESAPLEWAKTQMNLGITLQTLGERESNVERLKLAIKAFRNALKEYSRESTRLEWAKTQMNLGNVLGALGERDSGTENLKLAVKAYNAALEEFARDQVPLRWATTQSNLGNALRILGSRENDTKILNQAVEAFHNALEERTRERLPLDWARTQMNLGIALKVLGSQEADTERLNQAVKAFHNALEERTRERLPLGWATTKMNLANTLRVLGEQESGTENLMLAVEAYNAALEKFTCDRVPLQWATTQINLGITLRRLGERTGRKDQLEAALQNMKNAYKIYIKVASMTQYERSFTEQIEAIEVAIAQCVAKEEA